MDSYDISMRLHVWVETDPGLKRESNQDSFLVDENMAVFAVADGMGGHKGGEVASSMAVQALKDTFINPATDKLTPRDALRLAYKEASARIFDKAKVKTELHGMGTTMVAAIYRDGILFMGNVGDSRVYMSRGQKMWQMTEDHSLINEQIRAGILTPENAAQVVAKNVITRSVGYEREVLCDIVERDVRPGEYYLLCSDGLHGMISDRRIAEIIDKTPPDNIVPTLIEEAKRNGGDDNITALLIHITD